MELSYNCSIENLKIIEANDIVGQKVYLSSFWADVRQRNSGKHNRIKNL
jgi:hypothetical protein